MADEIMDALGGEPKEVVESEVELKDAEKKKKLEEFLGTLHGITGGGNIELTDSQAKKDREEAGIEEDDDESVDVDMELGDVEEKIGEYGDEMVDDMKMHPEKYIVNTPRGQMTLKDAIKKGWSPKTGDFTEEDFDEFVKEGRSKLAPSDQEMLEKLTDPHNAGIPAAQGEELGLEEGDPRIMPPQGIAPGEGHPGEGEDMFADIPPEILEQVLAGGGM